MDRRTALRLAGGAAGVAVAGCLGGSDGPNIHEQVPETAEVLLQTEGEVATDPETARLRDLFGGGIADPLVEFEAETGLDAGAAEQLLLFSGSSDAVFGAGAAEATIVHGDYENDEIRPAFESTRGIPFTEVEYKGESLFVSRPGVDDTESLALLGEGEFVFGQRTAVETALDVHVGDREPISGPLLDAFRDVGDDALVRFAVDPPEEDPVGEVPEEQVEEIEALAGGFRTPTDQVSVTARLDASADDQAAALETEIEASIQRLVENQDPEGPIADELGKVEIGRDGDVVTLTYESSLDAVEALIEALLGSGPGTPGPPGDSVTNSRTGRSFGSIQAAIDDDQTSDGDTIVIAEQPQGYQETVTVYKSVTIRGRPRAVLDGDDRSLGNAIVVEAPDVTIQNLTVRDYSGSGVSIYADGARIESVQCENTFTGFQAEFVSNVEISDAAATNNEWNGVDCYGVTNLTLEQVRAEANSQTGVAVNEVQEAELRNVQMTGNISGSYLITCQNLTLEQIECSSNEFNGLACLDASNVTMQDVAASQNGGGLEGPDGWGILAVNMREGSLEGVRLQGNGRGATLLSCSDVTLDGWEVTENTYGLNVSESSAVTVENSSVASNEEGIFVTRPTGDLDAFSIRSNDIVDNEAFGLAMEPTFEESRSWADSMESQAAIDERIDDAFYERMRDLAAEYEELRTAVDVEQASDGGPLQATGNWWGDGSGPGGDGPGSGDAVFGDIDFDPWSTEPGPDWNTAGGN